MPRLVPELATALHVSADRPALVIAPFIGDKAAELLRARGIDYADSAGNAHLAWDDVLVDVRGRRRPSQGRPVSASRGAKAFSRSGVQVIFVLLAWPHTASGPLRDLARVSGVSVGTAQMVVDELGSSGHIYVGSVGRQLTRGGELLARWAEAYSISLGPKLSLGNYEVADPFWWKVSHEDLSAAGVQVGGEAGASVLDPYLRPSTLTLYADAMPHPLMGQQRMTKAHGVGNVHVRRRFWRAPEAEPDSWLVPSALIYADLLASGDPRQREQGDRLRTSDDRLRRLDRA